MTKKLLLSLVLLVSTQANAMFSRVALAARTAVPAARTLKPAAIAVRTFKDKNSIRPLDVGRVIFLEKSLYDSPKLSELKNAHYEKVKEAYQKSINSKEYLTAIYPINKKYLEELEKLYQLKRLPIKTNKPITPDEREAVAFMITGTLGALTTPLVVFLAFYL